MIVQVEGLTHRYGERVALDDLSFTVEAGERFALVGPNGGGKSTLFRILATLQAPSSGRVVVDGHDLSEAPDEARRALGVVFQNASLDPKLTVGENLAHHGHLYGLDGPDLQARIQQGLAAGRLEDRRDELVETLSGGLRRRVELVKALLHSPRLVLLDEPTTGLDPGARQDFWAWVDQVRADTGATLLLTTHLLDEAEASDRVLLLDRGRAAALGRPDELAAEIQGEVLQVRGPDEGALATWLRQHLELEPTPDPDGLLVEAEDGAALAPRIFAAGPDLVRTVTIGRPGLAAVFRQRTGQTFWQDQA